MADTDYLAASDGTGDAALMHVTTPRTAGATIIQVDTVAGVPAFFVGTWGTLLASGFIDPATKRDFFGHVNAGTLVIDKMAPGNTDGGNTSGQVVVIKPNTAAQNTIANALKNVSPAGAVQPYAGLTAPAGWLNCDGSAVLRSTYSTLFAALAISTTGSTTSGSATVSLAASNSTIQVGMPISGAGIPTGAYVAAIAGTTLTLSQSATATGASVAITIAPYGIGDGSTTFNLPDMRGRSPIGVGTGTFSEVIAQTTAVNTATDQLTVSVLAGKQLINGTPVQVATTGTLPAPLLVATTYYAIAVDATHIKLATSVLNAAAGTAIDITTTGAGTMTITLTLSARVLGDRGGEEGHAQTVNELNNHAHSVFGAWKGDTGATTGSELAKGSTTPPGTDHGSFTDASGSSAAANVMQPFLALNYIIKT